MDTKLRFVCEVLGIISDNFGGWTTRDYLSSLPSLMAAMNKNGGITLYDMPLKDMTISLKYQGNHGMMECYFTPKTNETCRKYEDFRVKCMTELGKCVWLPYISLNFNEA